MTYFSRKQDTRFTKLAFDPEQARDANGRWVAVSVGRGVYGVEGVRSESRGGKTIVVSAGLRPEEFASRQEAEAFAKDLADAVRSPEKPGSSKRKNLGVVLVRSGTGIGMLLSKAFNSDQPRDDEGQWTNGGGGGEGSIKPVSARAKLTIQDAAKELGKRGYTLGAGRVDFAAGATKYTVTDRKGVTVEVSAKEIEKFLKGKSPKLKPDPDQS